MLLYNILSGNSAAFGVRTRTFGFFSTAKSIYNKFCTGFRFDFDITNYVFDGTILHNILCLIECFRGKKGGKLFYVSICSDIFTASNNKLISEFYVTEKFASYVRAACDSSSLQLFNTRGIESELIACTVRRGDIRLKSLPLPDLNSKSFAKNDTALTAFQLMRNPNKAGILLQLNQSYMNLAVPSSLIAQIYSAYNNGM